MKPFALISPYGGTLLPLIVSCLIGLTAFAPDVQAQSPRIDLGARQAVAVIALPAQTWREVNRFVYLITAEEENDLSRQFQEFPTYPDIVRSSREWKDANFQFLQQLAERLAKGETRRLLTELKWAIDHRESDPKGAEEKFGSTYRLLKQDLRELAAVSNRVADNLSTLSRLMEVTFPLYRQAVYNTNRPVGESKTLVIEVKAALAVMNGQWTAIGTDLDLLHAKVETKLASADPDLRDLYVNFGLETWERIEASAMAYTADVPAQLNNLTGDFYYDLTTVREGVPYVIQNSDQDGGLIGGFDVVLDTSSLSRDIADPLLRPDQFQTRTVQEGLDFARKNGLRDDMLRLRLGYRARDTALGSAASNRRKEWYFVKAGSGFWNIVSGDRNPREVLGTLDNGDAQTARNNPALPFFPIMVSKISAASSDLSPEQKAAKRRQLWRVICDSQYACRIYNAHLGESRRLEYRRTLQGIPIRPGLSGRIPMDACVMAPSDNHRRVQDWQILVPGRDYLLP